MTKKPDEISIADELNYFVNRMNIALNGDIGKKMKDVFNEEIKKIPVDEVLDTIMLIAIGLKAANSQAQNEAIGAVMAYIQDSKAKAARISKMH